MFKVDKGFMPPYVSSVFFGINADVHSYNTRFATNYQGRSDGGIYLYIPTQISPPKIFMGYFFLLPVRQSINRLQLVEDT